MEEDLAPLERGPEQCFAGEYAHGDKAACRREGGPGLVADVADQAGRRRHRCTPTTTPRVSRRSGSPCRTPPPCSNPVSVSAASLLVGSKTDHRTVPDAVPAVHRIGRVETVTVTHTPPCR